MTPPSPVPGNSNEHADRREDALLREVIQELVDHVRDLARRAKDMSPQDLEYAQQRLEWLADEVWRTVTEFEKRSGTN